MSTAIACKLCEEPIEGKHYNDSCCGGAVCCDCAISLDIGRANLNRAGMVGIYRGPCPDNDFPLPEDGKESA